MAGLMQATNGQLFGTTYGGGAYGKGTVFLLNTNGGVPTPGDSEGVAVPSVQAAAGTSEQSGKVDGVSITALAPPGKPDGEVDTRPLLPLWRQPRRDTEAGPAPQR